MPYAECNGVELYFELSESGTKTAIDSKATAERLLFISGTGADLRRQPRLTDGSQFEAFELLQFDQRGLGRSGAPEGPYTMAEYGDDAAALLDAVGWKSARVLGVSFGGMVAQELAIRHSDRVERLVLACTSSGGAGGASYPLHELADLDPEEALPLRFEILDTRWDAAWRGANTDMVRMLTEGFQLARAGDEAARGPRLQLEARRHHDTSARLAQIRCPTLVCAGRFDGIAPPANSDFLARNIPGARLEVFDGGHIFFMQDPAAFPAMAEFLRVDDPT